MAGSSFAKGSNLLAGKGRSLLNVACERVCALDQKTGSERASRTCATSGRRHAFRRRSHLAGARLALHGASGAISGETGTAAAAWSMLPVVVVETRSLGLKRRNVLAPFLASSAPHGYVNKLAASASSAACASTMQWLANSGTSGPTLARVPPSASTHLVRVRVRVRVSGQG